MMTTKTFNYLIDNEQMMNAMITASGVKNAYLDAKGTRDLFELKTELQLIKNDKRYTDFDGTDKNFFPDDYVTIIGDGVLGNTYYGTTPEERTLLGDSTVDVSIVKNGIAIAKENRLWSACAGVYHGFTDLFAILRGNGCYLCNQSEITEVKL